MMRKLEPQLNNEFNNDLFGVMSMINEPGEMASFLRDILTIDEIEEISKRLRVAKLLRKKVTVREIAKRTASALICFRMLIPVSGPSTHYC
jgi:uncharacterized protein YerC